MSEIFVSRSYVLEDAQRMFRHLHHMGPDKAQVARALVIQSQKAISHYFENGLLTQKQFDKMLDNRRLQRRFAMMALSLDHGKIEDFKRQSEDIKDRPDLLCGWLDYYSDHLQIKHEIDLEGSTIFEQRYGEFEESSD